MAATHIEKSTVASGQLNSVSSGGSRDTSTAAAVSSDAAPALVEGAACTMRPGDPGFDECEACQ
jgi:ribonucleoside-diphosphate reductase alpha chain